MLFRAVIAFCGALVCAKDLHVKESYALKEIDSKKLQDFYNDDENVYIDKERYARHVQLVTESVIEHIIKEINKKYPPKNGNDNFPRMMQRLKMKLKEKISKKKNKKHKKKRVKATEKDNAKRNSSTTS